GGDFDPRPFSSALTAGRGYARRRLRVMRAPLTSSSARIARPTSESVGTWGAKVTANDVGSSAAAVPGSSVRIDDSLVPLPSASKKTVPWLEIVVPLVPLLISAWMVIVTEPPAAIEPFQCTVRPGTSMVAAPVVAEALTRVRVAGR